MFETAVQEKRTGIPWASSWASPPLQVYSVPDTCSSRDPVDQYLEQTTPGASDISETADQCSLFTERSDVRSTERAESPNKNSAILLLAPLMLFVPTIVATNAENLHTLPELQQLQKNLPAVLNRTASRYSYASALNCTNVTTSVACTSNSRCRFAEISRNSRRAPGGTQTQTAGVCMNHNPRRDASLDLSPSNPWKNGRPPTVRPPLPADLEYWPTNNHTWPLPPYKAAIKFTATLPFLLPSETTKTPPSLAET